MISLGDFFLYQARFTLEEVVMIRALQCYKWDWMNRIPDDFLAMWIVSVNVIWAFLYISSRWITGDHVVGKGFHAMASGLEKTVYIDPVSFQVYRG